MEKKFRPFPRTIKVGDLLAQKHAEGLIKCNKDRETK